MELSCHATWSQAESPLTQTLWSSINEGHEIASLPTLVTAASSSKGRTAGSSNHYLAASSQPLEGLLSIGRGHCSPP